METAVEFLIKAFQDAYGDKVINVISTQVEQAKEMEKQQMFEYIKNNIVIGEKTLKFFQEEFEKYYNKKFNNLKISKLDLF